MLICVFYGSSGYLAYNHMYAWFDDANIGSVCAVMSNGMCFCGVKLIW